MADLRDWLYILSASIGIGALVYSWIVSRSKANAANIEKIESRLAENERSTEVLRTKVEGLMEIKREIGVVHRRIDQILDTVSSNNGQLQAIARGFEMVNSHLLGRKAE